MVPCALARAAVRRKSWAPSVGSWGINASRATPSDSAGVWRHPSGRGICRQLRFAWLDDLQGQIRRERQDDHGEATAEGRYRHPSGHSAAHESGEDRSGGEP